MGINTVAAWPQHNRPDGEWCRWSACHAAAPDIVCPNGCPGSDSSVPGLGPLGLGDKINGGIIIAYRSVRPQLGPKAWAAVLVFRLDNAADRYVVTEVPTDRHVTAWAPGLYFRDIAEAVKAFEAR